MNTATAGSAVILKLVDGSFGIKISSSTGADAGTGDVVLKLDTTYLNTLYAQKWDTVSAISANTTAVAWTLYILTASLTLTLPAAPAIGDAVGVLNLSGTLTPAIARNSLKIMNSATDLTVDKLNAGFVLVYSGATYGWVII